MGLFDSTIETLSQMAINESGLEIPQVAPSALVDEFKATLDMMPALNEEEMIFPDYAVPIRESSRFGYLIEMEDISRYMLTNGITNLLEAVDNIGRANGIKLNNRNVALVIDEASIEQDIDDLGMNIGGPNTNEGNIGTVGLLGTHTDLSKFRRFANSREFVDVVCNKYGLPVVKKNYTIGLVPVKHDDIHHNGNIQEGSSSGTEEDVEFKADQDTKVLNEKDKKENGKDVMNEDDSYMGQAGKPSLLERIRNSPEYKAAFSNPAPAPNPSPAPKPTNIIVSRDNQRREVIQNAVKNNPSMFKDMNLGGDTAQQWAHNFIRQNGGYHEDSSLQYIRDIAFGKYDDEIFVESNGGPTLESILESKETQES